MSTCALSGSRLERPVMCCKRGSLYNREAALEFLLKKKKGEWYGGKKAFGHISKMKDLFGVTLEDYNAAATRADVEDAESTALFMCPVTKMPMNGMHAFVAIRACGHVFSDKARKAVQGTACLVCNKTFSEAEVVPICGSDEALAARKAASKANKKRKRQDEAEAAAAEAPGPSAVESVTDAAAVVSAEEVPCGNLEVSSVTSVGEDTCAICLNELLSGGSEQLRTLPCSHRYHRDCIARWLGIGKNDCPICKKQATHTPSALGVHPV